MSVPTPASRTSPIQLASYVLLFVLALALGDYYVLTHGSDIAQAHAGKAAQQAAQQLLAQQTTPPAPGGTRPGRIQEPDTVLQRRAKTGIGITGLMQIQADKLYAKIGLGVRLFVLLSGVLLLFVIPAPEAKPGQPQPRKLDPKTIQIATLVCAGFALLGAYVLLTIRDFGPALLPTVYPVAAGIILASGGIAGALRATAKQPAFGLTSERKKVSGLHSLYFTTEDGGWISIVNPYQGTLVLGGAGAGKTYSIGEPMIEQFAEMNFSGVVYDFKFPVLAEAVQKAHVLAERKREAKRAQQAIYEASLAGRLRARFAKPVPEKEEVPVQLHFVNFYDLTRSERVNPLRASEMPVVAYADEYSKAIINNLSPSSIKNPTFFDTSAVAYLASIIWFYRQHHPEFCTLPHVIATAVEDDYKHVLSMLDTDVECSDKARSVISAVKSDAGKQVAAVVGTLQNILAGINSPQIVWVLTPDEANGEGFSLNLNDPDEPKLLCVGNNPTLSDTFAPVVSCLISVCIKLMNQQHKHQSYVFLDEAPTIYIPGLERLPATARSNRVATVCMAQDFAQMIDMFGKDKTNALVGNLGNQFYGKVNSLETAKHVSEMVGREEKEMTSVSLGKSQGTGRTNTSSNQSTSYQERFVVRPQDTITLKLGEFIGQTVGSNGTFFKAVIKRETTPERFPLHPFVSFGGSTAEEAAANQAAMIEENFRRVRKQVKDTLSLYPNTLVGATQ